jgi:hypothetical protein
MEAEAIRLVIREKLTDGRLPYNSTPIFWGGPADREVCDACDKPITKQQLVMEGIASTLNDKKLIQFHVRCFQIWDVERRAPEVVTTNEVLGWMFKRFVSSSAESFRTVACRMIASDGSRAVQARARSAMRVRRFFRRNSY